MAADGHLGHTKMEKNFATVVPIDVMCLHTCTAVARLTLALAKISLLTVKLIAWKMCYYVSSMRLNYSLRGRVLINRVVNPEISSGRFPEIYSHFSKISGKLTERFYRELFTTTNLPNNCTFGYNDGFYSTCGL